MTALPLTITRAGQARLAAAQLAGSLALQIARVGLTDQAFAPAPTLLVLPGEHRRLDTVSGAVVGGDTVHLTVRDDVGDGYGVRGIGLFLDDGTLFAAYGQDARLAEKSAQVALFLALDIAFPIAGIDRITFGDANFLVPPATTATKGVVELATQAEADAGAAGPLAITAALLARAVAAVKTYADTAVSAFASSVVQALAGLTARTIYGSGLVKGGGDLTANRTLTVDAASVADILAGTSADSVVTPRGLASLPKNLTTNGSATLPGGTTLKWGRFTAASNGLTNVAFDQPFPTNCFVVVGGGAPSNGIDAKDNWPGIVVSSITSAGFQAFSADDTADGCTYFAVGN